jgi:hypothetical protein
LQHLSLSLTCPKTPTQPTLFSWPTIETKKNRGDKHCGHPWGGCTVAAQATLPLLHDWTGVG